VCSAYSLSLCEELTRRTGGAGFDFAMQIKVEFINQELSIMKIRMKRRTAFAIAVVAGCLLTDPLQARVN